MSKFKVGDEVIVINDFSWKGHICTIIEIWENKHYTLYSHKAKKESYKFVDYEFEPSETQQNRDTIKTLLGVKE